MTPRYTVMNCLGMERMAAIENVMMPMPHVAKTAVVTGRIVRIGFILSDDRVLTMTGNGTQSRNECYRKATFSDDFGQTSIRYLVSFQFLTPSTTAIFEGTDGKGRRSARLDR
jgi:hypothetical protein